MRFDHGRARKEQHMFEKPLPRLTTFRRMTQANAKIRPWLPHLCRLRSAAVLITFVVDKMRRLIRDTRFATICPLTMYYTVVFAWRCIHFCVPNCWCIGTKTFHSGMFRPDVWPKSLLKPTIWSSSSSSSSFELLSSLELSDTQSPWALHPSPPRNHYVVCPYTYMAMNP